MYEPTIIVLGTFVQAFRDTFYGPVFDTQFESDAKAYFFTVRGTFVQAFRDTYYGPVFDTQFESDAKTYIVTVRGTFDQAFRDTHHGPVFDTQFGSVVLVESHGVSQQRSLTFAPTYFDGLWTDRLYDRRA